MPHRLVFDERAASGAIGMDENDATPTQMGYFERAGSALCNRAYGL